MSNRLGISCLDVGQGDCTFIIPPRGEGHPILVDCADPYVAERFVSNHTITDLHAVVASHLDDDHVRGLLPFLRNHFEAGRRVGTLVIGLDRHLPTELPGGGALDLIEAALRWEETPPHPGFRVAPPFRTDQPVMLAQGTDWSVGLVLPWYGAWTRAIRAERGRSNRCSAVLRITRGPTAILLGGDAPLGSWERLEDRLRPARAIRVSHHGGDIREGGQRWSDYQDLYDAVGATVAVLSVGTRNGYGHPLEEHAHAIRRGGDCRLLCTQVTPRCHDDLAGLRERAIELTSHAEWPYRHKGARARDEVPCAGTIVLWLDARGHLEVEPSLRAHEQQLLHIGHPLCRR